jgi:hypothetical protein
MTAPQNDRSDLNATDPRPGESPDEVADAPVGRQPGQLVELFVEGTPEPFTVRVLNRDRIAYEKTAMRHREWPPIEHGQSHAMTFVTWCAARRLGLTELKFEAWETALEDWNVIGEQPSDPTR